MKIYCDSSIREACFIIEGQKLVVIPYTVPVTNNVGEYQAVILALEEATRLQLEEAEILTDSLLVVNQVNGVWSCRKTHLLPFLAKVRGLAQSLQATVGWVPREQNLAGRVLG